MCVFFFILNRKITETIKYISSFVFWIQLKLFYIYYIFLNRIRKITDEIDKYLEIYLKNWKRNENSHFFSAIFRDKLSYTSRRVHKAILKENCS